DADETVDLEPRDAVRNLIEGRGVARVHEGARCAQQRAAARGVQLRDLRVEGVQVHVGHVRVQQAAEALDEAEQLDAQVVGPHRAALDGGIEGRGVPARGEDPDALHGRVIVRPNVPRADEASRRADVRPALCYGHKEGPRAYSGRGRLRNRHLMETAPAALT